MTDSEDGARNIPAELRKCRDTETFLEHFLCGLDSGGRPGTAGDAFDGRVELQILDYTEVTIKHIALRTVSETQPRILRLADDAVPGNQAVAVGRSSETRHHTDHAALTCTDPTSPVRLFPLIG